ncbi:SGNH/GDSL hydrolase family protein [Beijerinckia mobilis]|uniref:SGNH/GDSL hydrolase family protein n=1 Tax=Beijerinckia mobilis TaxID=231434 RepID=UPI000559320A|nr:DUF459 domain-containing protein [Beijerinckia mobilis]
MRFPFRPRSVTIFAAILGIAGIAFAALVLGTSREARAQGSPFDWFQNLFEPPPPAPRHAPPRNPHNPRLREHPTSASHKPRPPRPRTIVIPAKIPLPPRPAVPTRYRVAIFGDELAQMLGRGLTEALSDRPDIAILREEQDGTGLVRPDVYDWPKAISDFLTTAESKGEKLDYAIMLIGSNDRKPLHEDDKVLELLSTPWQAVYGSRIEAIGEIFRTHHVPLAWIGLPIVKRDEAAVDFSVFNTLFEERTAKTGATFIDIWEAFADEKGDYHGYGPDIDGQITKLRTQDGQGFTAAGERKLAHFVEGTLRRTLPDKPNMHDDQTPIQSPEDTPASGTPSLVNPPAAGEASANPEPEAIPPKPVIGPVLSLTGPALSHGGVLVSPDGNPRKVSEGERTLLKGVSGSREPAQPGQATDFSLPPSLPAHR